jgi:hypothetical protein
MPGNQKDMGKGMKGRNDDELSGAGTSSAGKTGSAGKLNDGGTPAKGSSRHGQANPGNSQQGENSNLQQSNRKGLSHENSGSGQRQT